MVAFSRLPDACQLALFKQLPLEDQLRFRSVCRQWDSLIPVAAGTRRSLVIMFGKTYLDPDFINNRLEPPITAYKPAMHLLKMEDDSPLFPQVHTTAWNCLKISRPLPENNGQLIASTFTGVSTLNVILEDENSKHFKIFAILLQLWRHQLISFHLHDSITLFGSLPETITCPLYAAINSLSSLKRLTLSLSFLPLSDLPVIAHLEELDISCRGFRRHLELATNLQKYGQSNRNLIQVGYTNSHTSFRCSLTHILKGFTSLSGHLRQAFTRLQVTTLDNKIRQHDLPTVCNHFQNLMTLEVDYSIDGNGLVPLFQELSKLKQLIYLSLRTSIGQLPLPNAYHPLPQLPSVKALVLELHLHSPQHMAALNIGWLFPNLQVIHFRLFGGDNFSGCGFGYVNREFPAGSLELAKECLRQVYRPLKRFFGNKLTILHDLGIFGGICSAEELLAVI